MNLEMNRWSHDTALLSNLRTNCLVLEYFKSYLMLQPHHRRVGKFSYLVLY